MGLISMASASAKNVIKEQFRDYFYCDAMSSQVLAQRGHKRPAKSQGFKLFSGGSQNADTNIISSGSIIAVNEGQCMLIVDQGAIVECSAQAGEFVFDSSTEPSLLYGDLGEQIKKTWEAFKKNFSFGGIAPKDQRIYFINTKDIVGNKYGTPSPVPFRVVDKNIGLDVDISVRCFGEYSFRIVDPILFYKNICGNVKETYTADQLSGQLRTELLTCLQPAFAKLSAMGLRYSVLPGHTADLATVMNEFLSDRWGGHYGIRIQEIGVNSIKASEEDEAMLKELQKNAVFKDPTMAAAHLVNAQASAMQSAASNQNAGSVMAFAGMNAAAANGGFNANSLYQMGSAAAQAKTEETPGSWTCTKCGASGNTGKYCAQCGAAKEQTPAPAAKENSKEDFWPCSCGTKNKGRFCTECGSPKPAGLPQYRCDKCGWEPEDPTHPPKFCPQCGDPFGDEDIV